MRLTGYFGFLGQILHLAWFTRFLFMKAVGKYPVTSFKIGEDFRLWDGKKHGCGE